MLPGHVPLDGALNGAVKQHLKARTVGTEQARLPLTALARGLHRRPAPHLDDPLQRRFGGGVNHQSFTRDRADQMVELTLNRGQIREDISVIELKVVQNRGTRAVMHKL